MIPSMPSSPDSELKSFIGPPNAAASMAKSRLYMAHPFNAWNSITKRIPKRFYRLFLIGLVVTVILIVHLTISLTSRPHHAPYTVPDVDPHIHGGSLSELLHKQEQLYPLLPFPTSPMITPEGQNASTPHRNPWLAAVICAAFQAERRMIIRSTWMRYYRDLPMDTRFVVSNPGPQWTEILRAENRTFGDIIVLDHLQEDDTTANTIKTTEFYKYLVDHDMRYEFVTKLDTDLFLNARGFWDRFIHPRLTADGTTAAVERTVIGQLYYSPYHDLIFPQGCMYTFTWDMVEELAALQERYHVVTGEDMVAAVLLLKARKAAVFVNFSGEEKFEYEESDTRGDGTPWARDGSHTNAAAHGLYGPDVIAVHELKSNKDFFKVATAFDETGIKPMPQSTGGGHMPPFKVLWFDFWHNLGLSRHYMSRFDAVPDFFWTKEGENWICDGIWNMGPNKEGHQESRAKDQR